MNSGYARVSTNEQNSDSQRDVLIRVGCSENNIFTDKITGTKQERKGLEQALSLPRHDDLRMCPIYPRLSLESTGTASG
jgi:DNA invertase Pin-like site-specific DNA recombinase